MTIKQTQIKYKKFNHYILILRINLNSKGIKYWNNNPLTLPYNEYRLQTQ